MSKRGTSACGACSPFFLFLTPIGLPYFLSGGGEDEWRPGGKSFGRIYFLLSGHRGMASADRQTDKGTWWSITAFDEEEQRMLASGDYPPYVKAIFGGLEECPETKRIHYQGAIQCRNQQRFSAIKKWLPKAHIEVAVSAAALQKYAMKDETAVGEKAEVKNKTPYVSDEMALRMIAKTFLENRELVAGTDYTRKYGTDMQKGVFWHCIRIILRKQPHLCGVMGKPDLWRLWQHTEEVWIELASEEQREGYSITALPASEARNEVIDPGASED